jgi:hypothetical protein
VALARQGITAILDKHPAARCGRPPRIFSPENNRPSDPSQKPNHPDETGPDKTSAL